MTVTDKDVDARITMLRGPMTDEQFKQALVAQKFRASLGDFGIGLRFGFFPRFMVPIRHTMQLSRRERMWIHAGPLLVRVLLFSIGVLLWYNARGRYEGNTLVVDVTNFNDLTWFDRAGNFHSTELKVEERFSRLDKDHLNYEATITDPKVFTRPWKIKMPLYRRVEPNAQILDFLCYTFEDRTKGMTVPLFRESPLK